MAWDFETEPEFQEHLDWMRELVDTQIIPLEPVLDELPPEEWLAVWSTSGSRSRTAASGVPSSTRSSAVRGSAS